MPDEMRLKLEQEDPKKNPKNWEGAEISAEGALRKLTVAVQILHALRQNQSVVDGRGLSIAITHIETAALWVKESTKVEEPLEG